MYVIIKIIWILNFKKLVKGDCLLVYCRLILENFFKMVFNFVNCKISKMYKSYE